MNKSVHVIKYVILDLLAAMLAWALFYIYRKLEVEAVLYNYDLPIKPDKNFYLGITLLPFA